MGLKRELLARQEQVEIKAERFSQSFERFTETQDESNKTHKRSIANHVALLEDKIEDVYADTRTRVSEAKQQAVADLSEKMTLAGEQLRGKQRTQARTRNRIDNNNQSQSIVDKAHRDS
jgi:hypothetical protein